MTVNRNGVDQGAIPKRLVTTKGDIIGTTANAIPARLGVGGDGETLVADSSSATGLAYREDYAAGKNKIINGDFTINQRAFTSATTSGTYIYDRFVTAAGGDGTCTFTPQVFTPGTAPVAGYEGKNYLRIVTSGQTSTASAAGLSQFIEDVRTFAGQTLTLSFWIKADTGTPSFSIRATQNFGAGGSSSVATFTTASTMTTSWVRYSKTISIPSISGKTIGSSGDSLGITIIVSAGSTAFGGLSGISIQNNTFEIWGVQAEDGSVATAFNTATGTIQGELAACQRYFQKSYPQGTAPATNSTANGLVFGAATATLANNAYVVSVRTPIVMRSAPTVTIYSFTTSQTARVSDATGTDLAASSGGTNLIGDSGFAVQNTSGGSITAANGGFVLHYQASAEL